MTGCISPIAAAQLRCTLDLAIGVMVTPLKIGLRLLATLLPLFLVGCSPLTLDVEAHGAAAHVTITVAFAPEFLDFSPKEPIELTHVDVFEWGRVRETPRPLIWRIDAAECQRIDAVTYGVPPARFRQSIAPETLKEGTIYAIDVEGCNAPHTWGMGAFRIVDGRVESIPTNQLP